MSWIKSGKLQNLSNSQNFQKNLPDPDLCTENLNQRLVLHRCNCWFGSCRTDALLCFVCLNGPLCRTESLKRSLEKETVIRNFGSCKSKKIKKNKISLGTFGVLEPTNSKMSLKSAYPAAWSNPLLYTSFHHCCSLREWYPKGESQGSKNS